MRRQVAPSAAGPTFTLLDSGPQRDLFPCEVAPGDRRADADPDLQLRFENCSRVAGPCSKPDPTPEAERANPSAHRGRGCHVTAGAGRRSRRVLRGGLGGRCPEPERVWPVRPEAGRSRWGTGVTAAREG